MSEYTPTIGLEIHAELKTRTKMFCDSLNDPDETRPNVNVCPVCMAHPGTLPVVNKEAVKQVLRMGVAIQGTIADYTEFDRKNYFYPDLPKGYQISQYAFPLVSGGVLNGVSITRIHLEEDAARTQHGSGNFSLIDFNRAGLPLMELVTEPCIHDAKTASAFASELQRLLRALGAGDANMEQGQMRVEANISISKDSTLGTKVEVKNLNSFKSVEKAIAFELVRQEELLERGERIVQETRGWDDIKNITFSQRVKEDSQQYRYFPDPDIPKFHLSRVPEFAHDVLKASLPELPWERRARYLALGLKPDDAETLLVDEVYASFFDTQLSSVLTDRTDIQFGINYLLTDIRGASAGAQELARLEGTVFIEVIKLLRSGDISSRGGKDLIAILLKEGGSPKELAEKRGLLQMKDTEAISKIADEVMAENPQVVLDLKTGKLGAVKFLLGAGMKKSKGSVNPTELEKIILEKLAASNKK
ncbi:MAG: Asp-tRNA(Asn)/Glu-tRNA(Gln) amidotransferase subunit GatB [Candidatus Pacebacteria bacterium]|nr:Asp-tRNA(Asn)/Glu-tRNA(Gln) amidotransferase subunit GatB [Candidatus Paceibacterota bacterium]